MGEVTQRARDKVCPGCGAKGIGKHTRLDCAWLKDTFERVNPARRRKGGKA